MPSYTPFFTDQQLKDIKEYVALPAIPYIKRHICNEAQRKEKDVDGIVLRTVSKILDDHKKEHGY